LLLIIDTAVEETNRMTELAEMHSPAEWLALEGQDKTTPCDITETVERIVSRLTMYRPQADVDLVRRAFTYACEKHLHQKRKSGEPYIIHPVEVTEILADLELDEQSLAAGLLHDVVEDCEVTVAELESLFGHEVAQLVDGVTKLQITGVDDGKQSPDDDEDELTPVAQERRQKQVELAKNAANLRKIFVAMAKDLRVMLIKLADRLHNMRTLDSLSPARQFRMAAETLSIFAPLAHRLGIWQLKWQLEDLSFKYVDPEGYAEVTSLIARTRSDRQDEVDECIAILQQKLKDEGIDAYIAGRPKHLYSIYNKMKSQHLEFSDLYDLIALRVIVHTRAECYQALGTVSALWPPIPGMYTDYIAQSKSNAYQSLHIKVNGPRERPLEVQIRTWEMHRTAEFGVAAHWQYKEGGKVSDKFERQLSFLRKQLFDWTAVNKDHNEFMRNMSDDLFTDQIFVRTPKGDVFDLPLGSTPVDFAYRVHSDVGQHCVGATVNGRMVPLSHQLKSGDTIKIHTRPNASPSRDWLAFVKSSHAKSRIKAFIKRQSHAEDILGGRDLLEKELAHQVQTDAKAWGETPRDLIKDDSLRQIATGFNVPDEQALLAAIGYGTVSALTVLNRLKPNAPPSEPTVQIGGRRADERKLNITADGMDADSVLFRRSRCCLPIPGDDVIGYVTRGRGMALHRRECPNARHYLEREPDRCMSVEYGGNDGQVFQVFLVFETLDRQGLLADVGTLFAENKTNITAVKTQSHRDKTATLELAIEVRSTDHLDMIIQKMRNLSDIIDIHRAMGGRDEVRVR
jgi:GTP diphosphokinase / guanosine-3',5'-bis(diphosphate) 3'-diphosphatase